MLRGGRGTATVLPASALCVCWFWQSRWLVIFSADVPQGMGACSKAFLTEIREGDEILSVEIVFKQ